MAELFPPSHQQPAFHASYNYVSGCQEGELASKELLNFHSKFCRFLFFFFFVAFWPQIRLYASLSQSEGGMEEQKQAKCEHISRVQEF